MKKPAPNRIGKVIVVCIFVAGFYALSVMPFDAYGEGSTAPDSDNELFIHSIGPLSAWVAICVTFIFGVWKLSRLGFDVRDKQQTRSKNEHSSCVDAERFVKRFQERFKQHIEHLGKEIDEKTQRKFKTAIDARETADLLLRRHSEYRTELEDLENFLIGFKLPIGAPEELFRLRNGMNKFIEALKFHNSINQVTLTNGIDIQKVADESPFKKNTDTLAKTLRSDEYQKGWSDQRMEAELLIEFLSDFVKGVTRERQRLEKLANSG